MKIAFLLPLLAGALVPAMAVAQPGEPDREAELAGLLANWRPAGDPERCINLRRATVVRVINRTAIVLRIGGAFYVMRPRAGAEYLDRRDAILSRLSRLYLCDGEIFETADPYSGIERLITSGPFIPYRPAD